MSTSRQAYCARFGHAWLPWGLFHTVKEPLEPVHTSRRQMAAEIVPIKAYRWRTCSHCGADQRQDWASGKTEDISDEN